MFKMSFYTDIAQHSVWSRSRSWLYFCNLQDKQSLVVQRDISVRYSSWEPVQSDHPLDTLVLQCPPSHRPGERGDQVWGKVRFFPVCQCVSFEVSLFSIFLLFYSPLSLQYGTENIDNLGPLIKKKAAQQKVFFFIILKPKINLKKNPFKLNTFDLSLVGINFSFQDLKENPVVLKNGATVAVKITTQGDEKV